MIFSVNPITGCLDNPTAPNPFANMTEEQKEYEAVQLVNTIQFFCLSLTNQHRGRSRRFE